MRIVVPYTQIHPSTAKSLENYEVEYIDVSQTVESYWRLMVSIWEQRESTLIIEHDMEVNDRAIRQAKYCKCEWSVSPYFGPAKQVLSAALGCTRFRSSFMAANADLLAKVGDIDDAAPTLVKRDWRRLDARMLGILRDRGYKPHIHETVLHHHVYQDGCACGGTHERI